MSAEPAAFAAFEAEARAAGYDEVLTREWAPGQVVGNHTHPFAVRAVVAQGEFWLTEGGQMRHLGTGATFELARDRPHAERYGADGATVWVARRHVA